MEGTMSEIRIFAGNFAPKTWAFCQGQTLAVQSNQALFALIGTYYGGNGTTTFMLPDLRGRTAIGQGQGPGLAAYTIGEQVGTETVTLNTSQMGAHIHAVQVGPFSASGSGSFTLNAVDVPGDKSEPGGNFFAVDNTGSASPYVIQGPGDSPDLMSANATSITGVVVPPQQVNLSTAGGSAAHNNMMPSIALNYIICIQGIFPSRN